MKLVSALIASIAVSSVALAAEKPFNVSATLENDAVRISFVTKTTFSSICAITTTALELKPSMQTIVNGEWTNVQGLIRIQGDVVPHTMCFMAFGPHRGQVELTSGRALPGLNAGEYALEINGQSYGVLLLSNDAVSLR